ncbi:hypothetical protein D9758_006332 [Tetrapyrgos nigripes]|uniref:BTB domain-containing protein n=1 Tax=Tetrapyrgos nigripes TaxID=182062 RepID=A0A8H5D8F8_9AGAR|nr:hypothetical protein D9758_006332 [Tetrapyrgos nigripes]
MPGQIKSNGVNGVNGVNGHHLNLNGSGTDGPIHPLRRSIKYHIPGGDLYVVVDDTQFRIHSYFFTRESSKFKNALSQTTLNGTLGSSSATPLFIHNTTAAHFEEFLWVFYNESYSIYDAPVATWARILRFANRWDFPAVRELAIRELEGKDIDLVERILIYQEQDVEIALILPLYNALVAREAFITPQEILRLGYPTAVMILQARERLRTLPADFINGINPLRTGVGLDDAGKVVESLLVDFPRTAPLEVSASSPLTPRMNGIH